MPLRTGTGGVGGIDMIEENKMRLILTEMITHTHVYPLCLLIDRREREKTTTLEPTAMVTNAI